MRHTVLTFLLLVVVVAVVTACAPSESERIAALEATIAALEEEGEEQARVPTEEPYPTPTGQATTTPTPVETRPSIIWTIQGKFLIGEDKVFTIENVSGGVVVHCFDIASGQQLWQWEEQWETTGKILEADPDHVYLGRQDGRFYALDARSGKEIWKITLAKMLGPGESWSLASQDENRLYLDFTYQRYGALSAHEHLLVAIDKNDGAMLWSRPGELLSSWGIILGRTEQTLLWASPLQGIDPATGELKWEFSESREIGTVQISEGAFFSTIGGTLQFARPIGAWDIDSGRKLWQTEDEDLDSIRHISPTSIYASTFSAMTPSDLRVFDRQTGEEHWGWEDLAGGFLGEFQEIAILSDRSSGFTWAVDARTGNILWENDDLVLDGVAGVSDGGTLLAWRQPMTEPCFLSGIDIASGQRKWRRQPETYGCIKPIDFRGRFFYSTGDSLVFLDPETGEQVATLGLPCQLTLAPDLDLGGYLSRGDLLLLYDLSCLLAIRLP